MNRLKPITNSKQYDEALERAYTLIQKDLKSDSKDFDELGVLTILIKEYENEHFTVPESTG